MSKAVALRRDELDLDRSRLWVRRLKGGLPVKQPAAGDELLAVKRHLGHRDPHYIVHCTRTAGPRFERLWR